MTMVKTTTTTKTSVTVTKYSPSVEELKRNIFVVLEMYKGYTEAEALKNYECEHGTCVCP